MKNQIEQQINRTEELKKQKAVLEEGKQNITITYNCKR